MTEYRAPLAVLFDVGNTLLEERRFDLEAGIGAVVDDTRGVDALAAAFRIETADRYRRHEEVLLAQWLVDRVPSLGRASVADIEDRIWAAVVTLVPVPLIAGVLARLSDDGVALAAVSNAAFSGRVLRAELARFHLADRLRFVLSSADVGCRKPAPAIFRMAVERNGIAPEHTWFVGDTMDEDITGALAAGVQPILLSANATPPRSPGPNVPVIRDWAEFTALYVQTARPSRAPAR
jgi:FMN phosphatase YigB (HAD superfamily)